MNNIEVKSERTGRTEQAIIYGSPYEALIGGFIEVTDILNYLLASDSVSDKTMIAYRAVCVFNREQIVINDNQDYNDKPFVILTKFEEYVAIYSLSFQNIHGRNEKERNEIAKRTQQVWSKLITLNEFSRKIFLICDAPVDIKLEKSDLWLVVAARSAGFIRKNSSLVINYPHVWIETDSLVHLNYKGYETVLVNRCELLNRYAPDYWKNIGISLYKKVVFENINTDKPNVTRVAMKRCFNLFPNLFPDKIVNMTDLEYKIRELPRIIQAYVLGFPIHIYVPDREYINEAINILNTIGMEKYCEMIMEKNKNHLSDFRDMITPWDNNDTSYGNEEDSLFESVYAYNSFDVIKYYIDTHVYFFTRGEFPTLVTKKINHWTNKSIPPSILCEVDKRCETSRVCELPKSAPLIDLIKRTEKGLLYKGEKRESNNNNFIVTGGVMLGLPFSSENSSILSLLETVMGDNLNLMQLDEASNHDDSFEDDETSSESRYIDDLEAIN